MAELTWDSFGSRYYEMGVDHGVLYVDSQPGVAWNGLTSVSEKPSGGSPRAFYMDGEKYLNLPSSEEFEATITAFTYPDEFGPCEGYYNIRSGLFASQQRRKSFGLSYQTKIGNDLVGADYGYKIHIVYNALAAPSERNYNTVADSSDISDFSWEITTRPPSLLGYKKTSHIVVDSRTTNDDTMGALTDILYGTSITPPRIPTPDELVQVFDDYRTWEVIDNADGTYTVYGRADAIITTAPGEFEITWPTAVFIDADSYTLTS